MDKKCPDCAELVKSEALVCRFCGHRFGFEDLVERGGEKREVVGKNLIKFFTIISLIVLAVVFGALAIGGQVQANRVTVEISGAVADTAQNLVTLGALSNIDHVDCEVSGIALLGVDTNFSCIAWDRNGKGMKYTVVMDWSSGTYSYSLDTSR